jgi:hypothetical protein
MKYWEISYYKTHNWIDTKYIKDEFAQGGNQEGAGKKYR